MNRRTQDLPEFSLEKASRGELFFHQVTELFRGEPAEILGKWCVGDTFDMYVHSDGMWRRGTKSDAGWTGYFPDLQTCIEAIEKALTELGHEEWRPSLQNAIATATAPVHAA